jgi:hypothetical protein
MSIEEFENKDSKAEAYFQWWLDELSADNYITDYIYHPRIIQLTDSVIYRVLNHKKTKDLIEERQLLADHQYSPDYDIIWAEKALGIFYKLLPVCEDKHIKAPFFAQIRTSKELPTSAIDVKGAVTFAQSRNYSTLVTFPFNQKWVYQRYGIYVCKAEIPTLFKHTFCPKRYLTQDIRGNSRALHFEPITLVDFLKSKTDG